MPTALRFLQSLVEVASEKNSTTIFPVPIDLLTPFLKKYMEIMGWDDLNWLEDVHLGYEEGRPAIFDRNINGWVTVPPDLSLPDNQQDRDMLARELLIKFQMSKRNPLADLKDAYSKF